VQAPDGVGSNLIEKAFTNAHSWSSETSQLSYTFKDEATVDAYGYVYAQMRMRRVDVLSFDITYRRGLRRCSF
jgi:hypothetical protein